MKLISTEVNCIHNLYVYMPYPVYMDRTSYTARQQMTMQAAIQHGLFTVECCMECGKEGCRLYSQLEGTYANFRYCRACALRALNSEYF